MLIIQYMRLIVPSWMLSLSVFNLGLGLPTIYLLRNGDIYHASIACAYMCLMFSIFFLILGSFGSYPRRWALLLGSLFLGLNFGSRAVELAYGALLPFMTWVLLARREEGEDRASTLINVSLLWGPYLSVLGLQGLYNYLRFGSFSEFGVSYMLTAWRASDMAHSMFKLGHLLRGWHDYFIGALYFVRTFPYVISRDDVSMFYLSPLLLILFFWIFRGRRDKNVFKRSSALSLLLSAFASIGFIELSLGSWTFVAHCVRYEMDFIPILALTATLVWVTLAQAFYDRPWLRRFWASLGSALILSGCLLNIAISIGATSGQFYRTNPSSYRRIEKLSNVVMTRLGVRVLENPS